MATEGSAKGAKLAYHANCWGPLGGNPVGVTSIAELTYRTFGDMDRAIAQIGEVGYSGVELFDGNLLDYDGRRDALRGSDSAGPDECDSENPSSCHHMGCNDGY